MRQDTQRWWVRLAAVLAVLALMPWPLAMGPDNWWAFILATAAIAAVLRLLLGRRWKICAGLDLPAAQAAFSIAAFALVWAASAMLLRHTYEGAGLRAQSAPLARQAGLLFQALNEEILFRGLLLGWLTRPVRPAPVPLAPVPLALVSLGLALIFPAAHFLLYRFSNPMHLALSLPALATLFLAGVAMNNLYLAFRHIGFSWALHAGWNIAWLPSATFDVASGRLLNEPQLFDRVLGAPAIAAWAFAVALLSFGLLARRASLSNAGT